MSQDTQHRTTRPHTSDAAPRTSEQNGDAPAAGIRPFSLPPGYLQYYAIGGKVAAKAETGPRGEAAGATHAGFALETASAEPGAEVDGGVRRQVEQVTGAALSHVRVHTGPASQAAASALHAQAYTVGGNIHFAAGRYQPGTPAGDHLVAHELAHTIQQGAEPVGLQARLEVSQSGEPAELEADRVASAAVGGATKQVTVAPVGIALQRQPADSGEPAAGAADVAAATKANAGLVSDPRAVLLQVRAHLSGLPLVNRSDDELSRKVVEYQKTNSLPQDGKIKSEATWKQLQADGLGTATWGKQLDSRDKQAMVAAKQGAADRKKAGLGARNNIIQTASGEIGLVNDLNRGDGSKYGGERINEYFRVAGVAANEDKNKHTASKSADWCGIFTIWAANLATGQGSWQAGDGGGPRPFRHVSKSQDPKLDRVQPGDILHIAPQNHHFLLVQKNGTSLSTIEGNTTLQQIISGSRTVAEIVGYYVTVEDGQSTAASAAADGGEAVTSNDGEAAEGAGTMS